MSKKSKDENTVRILRWRCAIPLYDNLPIECSFEVCPRQEISSEHPAFEKTLRWLQKHHKTGFDYEVIERTESTLEQFSRWRRENFR